ncbi:MAG: sialate O-acetylesterase, partial [Planctomycetota bacterium]
VKKILADIGKYYPGADSYEVAGFVWWQGHKDQNAAHASRYEQNLVHLINTLRSDFDAPLAKFVLATIGFGGDQLSGHGLTVAEAQLAVSGEKGSYPQFKGNVKTIDARPFWRDRSISPGGAGHHYNLNAETYLEVGTALGQAMVELLDEGTTTKGTSKKN